VLLRDRPLLEVFVLRRNPGAAFGPGASVFPGGGVDPADREPTLARRTTGLDETAAGHRLGTGPGALAHWHAAARECFEEAGLLLARRRASGEAPDHADADVAARLSGLRHALNRGDLSWADVLDAEDLVLDARDLRVLAHWLTPVGAPRRYDTWFFVAPAPDGQDGVHDDVELVASGWVAPSDALERHERGEIDLIFPTWRTLLVLARYRHAQELLDELDAAIGPDGTVPVVREGSGERVRLRGDEAPVGAWTIPLPDPSTSVDRALVHGGGAG
jgi:8-oxo-dGTP pyrophosphatase MutT (NUDIX family)